MREEGKMVADGYKRKILTILFIYLFFSATDQGEKYLKYTVIKLASVLRD